MGINQSIWTKKGLSEFQTIVNIEADRLRKQGRCELFIRIFINNAHLEREALILEKPFDLNQDVGTVLHIALTNTLSTFNAIYPDAIRNTNQLIVKPPKYNNEKPPPYVD